MNERTDSPVMAENEVTTGRMPVSSLSMTVEVLSSLPGLCIEVPPPSDWIYSRECMEELEEAQKDLAEGDAASFASVEDLLKDLKG